MTRRLVLVGTGGQGERWCSTFLPPHVAAGRVEVVAAADVDAAALENAQEHLDVAPADCYEEFTEAFASHPEADCCAVVVPPWLHEDVVDAALAHDLDVLSEKPIADTLAASVRIAEKVERAGAKMGVTMTHRFDRDKTTLRRALRGASAADGTRAGDETADRGYADPGPVDYLVGRLTCNLREYGQWGAFRHDMDHPLLVDGAVHQLDFLADMAGGRVETLYADTWRPEWAEYEGDCQALVQFRTDAGTRVQWEGAKANAAGLNCWGDDYVRAECRDATLVLDERELVRHDHDSDPSAWGRGDDDPDPVPLADDGPWGNTWLVAQFLDWVEGGPAMATDVESNLQSVALVEAAVRSSETGSAVQVQDLLAETREAVRADLG